MRAFKQQPLLGMVTFRGHCDRTWPCTTVLRGTASEDGWGKRGCAWGWNGVLETCWVLGAFDRELPKLHGVVVKRQREETWAKRPSYFGTEASCLRARLHSVTNDACMPAQCLPQAESNLGTVRTLRCVPSITSAAFLDRLSSSLELLQLSFVDFEKRRGKKTTSNIAPKGQKSDHGKRPNFEVVDLSLWKRYEHRSSTSTKLVVRAKAPSRFQVLPAWGRVPAIAQKRYISRVIMPWHFAKFHAIWLRPSILCIHGPTGHVHARGGRGEWARVHSTVPQRAKLHKQSLRGHEEFAVIWIFHCSRDETGICSYWFIQNSIGSALAVFAHSLIDLEYWWSRIPRIPVQHRS